MKRREENMNSSRSFIIFLSVGRIRWRISETRKAESSTSRIILSEDVHTSTLTEPVVNSSRQIIYCP